MNKMKSAVTINDVAKAANVSASTVSRVISDSSRISKNTKAIVFQAMEKMNYHPNAIARSLANKKTNTLGLIIPNSDENLFMNPFFIYVMRGISIYSQKQNYHIMYTYSSKEDEEVKFLQEYINSHLVDGVILLTSIKDDKCIQFLHEADFPFVVIGRPEITDNTIWVDNDNFQATYKVTNLLIDKGFKKIGFIGGNLLYNFSSDRFDGYMKALKVRGIEFNENLVLHNNGFDFDSGYIACKKILRKDTPDALVTVDDLLGYGALKYLNDINDSSVTVTGFNNISINLFKESLFTTVEINADQLGYHAAKLLIEKLHNKLSSNHHIVDTRIIEKKI